MINKKAQLDFDFDEEQIVGVIAAVICALVTLIVMKRVEGIGIFWKIMGGVAGAVIGYFMGAKIGAGG